MAASSGELRIGIVGAGRVALRRHLPGFEAEPGVKVVGVCNRGRESAARAAREWDIPKIYSSWEDMLDDDEVDAIAIAAWPYLHCPITLAALDAGKHVLTQAPMAMNAREAHRMLDRSRASPELVAMVAPGPYGLALDAFVRATVAAGYLGTVREVHVRSLSGELADPRTPLNWRQKTKYSGFNMLDLAFLHEVAHRWGPPVSRVSAHASKLIPARPDPARGAAGKVGTPDSVQAFTDHEGGSRGTFRLGGLALHGGGIEVALYGSEGTLICDLDRDEVRGARRGDAALAPLPIPESLRDGWRTEADFVAAIRGGPPVERTTFVDGARTMQFTEAVARSSRHQSPVDLPLQEFSNPTL